MHEPASLVTMVHEAHPQAHLRYSEPEDYIPGMRLKPALYQASHVILLLSST